MQDPSQREFRDLRSTRYFTSIIVSSIIFSIPSWLSIVSLGYLANFRWIWSLLAFPLGCILASCAVRSTDVGKRRSVVILSAVPVAASLWAGSAYAWTFNQTPNGHFRALLIWLSMFIIAFLLFKQIPGAVLGLVLGILVVWQFDGIPISEFGPFITSIDNGMGK